ncbi:hypothetical protein B1A_01573, partial [mine drainage metagenome]
RLAENRNRRAPTGAQESVRLGQSPPHQLRQRVRRARGGRRYRHRDQPGRPEDRRVSILRRRWPARQQDRIRGAHYPRADQHRGRLPDRAQPARQPRPRDEDAQGQAVRAGTAQAQCREGRGRGHQVRYRLGQPDPQLRARPVAHQGPAHRYRTHGHAKSAGWRSRRVRRGQPEGWP